MKLYTLPTCAWGFHVVSWHNLSDINNSQPSVIPTPRGNICLYYQPYVQDADNQIYCAKRAIILHTTCHFKESVDQLRTAEKAYKILTIESSDMLVYF